MKWHANRKHGSNLWVWDENSEPVCEIRTPAGTDPQPVADLIVAAPAMAEAIRKYADESDFCILCGEHPISHAKGCLFWNGWVP